MREVLGSRLLFAFGSFSFAVANVAGTVVSVLTNVLAGIGLAVAAMALGQRHALARGFAQPGIWLTAALVAGSAALLSTALAYTPLPVVAVLTQMEPAFALALAPLFGERVGRSDGLALLVGGVGTAVLVGDLRGTQVVGALLVAGASLCAAWFSLRFAADSRNAALPGCAYMSLVTGLGGVMLAPWQPFWNLRSEVYVACAAAAVCYGSGYLLVYRGMRTVQATHVLLLRPIGALTAGLLGVLLLDADLTADLLVGGALILAAGQLTERSVRRRRVD